MFKTKKKECTNAIGTKREIKIEEIIFKPIQLSGTVYLMSNELSKM